MGLIPGENTIVSQSDRLLFFMTYYIKETSVRQDTWQMEFHWLKNPPKKLWGVGAEAG